MYAFAACAPTGPGAPDGGGTGASTPGGGGGGSGLTGGGSDTSSGGGLNIKPPTTVSPDCGNGVLNGTEQCDDGNDDSLDGCNQACQKSPDYDCPVEGQPCISNVRCGDGRHHSTEACDEGAASDGIGCAADCLSVDVGWQCRVPGRACIPLCGDGLLTAGENCDDLNTVSGDGCSSNCLVEPGYDCGETGLGPCIASVCGNGVVEVGESCDAGDSNGLFFGDGTGCSKTCTNEPVCRDAAGVTQACSTACGDGNIDTGEACDDGNAVPGDGCSELCALEGGFDCPTAENPDTVPCPAGGGDCLILPVTYRDFDSSHPDFYFLGEGGVECVPNASGNKDTTNPTECWDGDSTDLCQGLAAAALGPDGKPVLGANTTCECRFTDWDSDLLPDSTAGEYSKCTSGAANPTRIETTVDIADSAASFAEWYHDSASATKVIDTLVLEASGGGRFQFSSSDGDTIADDLADGAGTLLDSGFFPLDTQNGVGSEQLCNMWPYWPNGVVSFLPSCSGDQWNPDANDGNGGMEDYDGMEHNFYFTSEVRYLFKYVGGEALAFYGDDDVFVYINGLLTLDLGAPHERLLGEVELSDTAATSTVYKADGTTDVSTTAMTLVPGNIYEIAIFHADRHPRESNYQLTLQGFSTTQSECIPACGDGVATTGEECDDGAANDDTLYGGCSTTCKYGPYCGDGNTDASGGEQCDDGVNNTASYGTMGCTSGCTIAPRCGDAIIDSGFGEECDDGDNNGKGSCDEECILDIVIK